MLIGNSNGRRVVALFAFILAGQCCVGQQRSQGTPCSPSIVVVSVSDSNGKPVPGLTAENFLVRLHGHPVKILSAKTDAGPRRIALILDSSGSMVGSQTWKPSLDVAKTLVESLPPEDSIAFLSFGSQVERKIDFTPDRSPILQQLDELQAGKRVLSKNTRGTALWDSVLESSKLFGSPQIGDAIYVISDGRDNRSRAGRRDIEKALLATRVRFFAVFPPGVPLPQPPGHATYAGPLQHAMDIEEPAAMAEGAQETPKTQGENDLEEIAKMTGGALLADYEASPDENPRPLAPTALNFALDQLRTATDQFYQLELDLPQLANERRDLRIEVVDQRHVSKVPLVLLYPQKFEPCGAGNGR